ncbi:MAG: ribonuclease III domain-containing protein, partial [Limibacillus sp.]
MASNSTDKSGAALDGLAEKLGHRFTDSRSLQRALTHSSASGAAGAQGSYERLEFLGDRVLGLVVADLLLRRFPEESEGSLAKRFAYLVSGEILSQVARDIGLGEFIAFSRGEADAGASSLDVGPQSQSEGQPILGVHFVFGRRRRFRPGDPLRDPVPAGPVLPVVQRAAGVDGGLEGVAAGFGGNGCGGGLGRSGT